MHQEGDTALEKLPADRFATATQFAAALVGDAPTRRHTVTLGPGDAKDDGKRTTHARRIAGFVLAGLIGAGVAAVVMRIAQTSPNEPASLPMRFLMERHRPTFVAVGACSPCVPTDH